MKCRGLILLGFFAASAAQAYLPPSFYIVRQLARKHSDLKNITVRSRLTFMDGSSPKSAPFTEVMTVSESDRVAIVVKNAEGRVVATAVRNLADGTANQPTLYGLSLLANGSNVYAQLKAAGIPLKTEAQLYAEKSQAKVELPYSPEDTVALGRSGSRVVLSISNEGRLATDPPQFWVDKASFLPVRMISRTDSGETLDLHFDNHAVYESSFYPRNIEVFRGGRLWVRIEYLDIKSAQGSGGASTNRISQEAGSLTSDLEAYMKWLR